MRLKQKIILIILALFFIFLATRTFLASRPPAEAFVRIRIETKVSDSGESLLLTQAKGITQNATMQELLRRLGRQTAFPEENQRRVLDLQKKIRVEQIGRSEIFKIIIRDAAAQTAREIASQWAQSFQAVELAQSRESAQADEMELEHQTADARAAITELEQTLKTVQEQNKPNNIDRVLVNRLSEKQSQYHEMLKTYTPRHPKMVDLDKEIESLKLQIMDGPPIDLAAVDTAEKNLRKGISRFRRLRRDLDDIRLEREEIAGRVKILEIASNSPKRTRTINPFYTASLALVLLLVVILRITRR